MVPGEPLVKLGASEKIRVGAGDVTLSYGLSYVVDDILARSNYPPPTRVIKNITFSGTGGSATIYNEVLVGSKDDATVEGSVAFSESRSFTGSLQHKYGTHFSPILTVEYTVPLPAGGTASARYTRQAPRREVLRYYGYQGVQIGDGGEEIANTACPSGQTLYLTTDLNEKTVDGTVVRAQIHPSYSAVENFVFDIDAVFNDAVRLTPGSELVEIDGSGKWVFNPNAVTSNIPSEGLRIELQRTLLSGTNEVPGGYTYITLSPPPELSFSTLEERYCADGSQQPITVRIASQGNSGVRSTPPASGGEGLKGTLRFFAREAGGAYSNVPILAETAPDGDVLSLSLEPEKLYQLSGSSKDSIFVRVEYLSRGSEGVGTSACGGSVSQELKIYKRPESPEFTYASGLLTPDEYCVGTNGTNAVTARQVPNSLPDDKVGFKWYASADGIAPDFIGRVLIGNKREQEPQVNANVQATRANYVSQVLYKEGTFAGCRSYATQVEVEITQSQAVDFNFNVDGTDVDNVCVADGAEVNYDPYEVQIVPQLPASVTTLGPGESLTFNVVGHITLDAKIGHQEQVGANPPNTISDATVSSFDLAEEIASIGRANQSFTTFATSVHMEYVSVDGKATCQSDVTKSITIHPLPGVSIANFGEKHCVSTEETRVPVQFAGFNLSFTPGDGNGNLQLFRKEGLNNYREFSENDGDPYSFSGGGAFYTTEGRVLTSQLEGSVEKKHRLVYTSPKNQVECVNRDTIDFTIYPRPVAPTVPSDVKKYCVGTTSFEAISVDNPDATVTYKWYQNANSYGTDFEGTGNVEETGTSFTPSVNTTSPIDYSFYASQTLYAAGAFEGCESFASKATISITDVPTVTLQLSGALAGDDVTAFCVANGADGSAETVSINPKEPLEVGDGLSSDEKLDIEFVASSSVNDQPTLNAINTLINNGSQSTGSVVAADFDVFEVVKKIHASVTNVSDHFAATTVRVRLKHTLTAGGSDCVAEVTQDLTFNPLPSVQISSVSDLHCAYAEPVTLYSVVGGSSAGWQENNVRNTGVFTLKWLSNGGVGGDVAAFHDGQSRLDFDQVYSDANVPRLDPTSPPTAANFRLLFVSGGGQTSEGCVNTDELDFTVNPRPDRPTVEHANKGDSDEYCQGTAVGEVTVENPIADAQYTWYEGARGSLATAIGQDFILTSTTRTPGVDASAVGRHMEFVSVTRHTRGAPGDANYFPGCESYVDTATVDITAAPAVDFQIDVGLSTDIAQTCIADVGGIAQTVTIIPNSPSAGSTLDGDLTYSISSSTTLASDFNTALGNNREQARGATAQSVTVTTLALMGIDDSSVGSVEDPFTRTQFTVRLFYSRGSDCAATSDKIFQINPLPRVSIVDFASKHCENGESVPVGYRIGTLTSRDWDSSDPAKGTVSLFWKENLHDPYQDVPHFTTSASPSAIVLEEVFSNSGNPSGIAPSEDEKFRLIYQSNSTGDIVSGNLSDNLSCVNRDTLLFTVYPGPLAPTVAYASGQSEDQYCKGSTVDEVSIVNARAYVYLYVV